MPNSCPSIEPLSDALVLFVITGSNNMALPISVTFIYVSAIHRYIIRFTVYL
ncbi:uncharacterized protein DS421_10g295210 [Arachis hypogaea]|nr:uncharacterized protein DS421_10g295210 [Arachis hypogaea]